MASKLSPMMQQYIEIKEQYKDEILFRAEEADGVTPTATPAGD